MNCVETAKVIRSLLKKEFPMVKFSVRSSRYSGGSSVTVYWTDFPSESTIKELITPFERVGRCEYTGEILSGGNMFVSTSHSWTKETRQMIENTMENKYGKEFLADHWANLAAFRDTVEELNSKWMNEHKAPKHPVKVDEIENNETNENITLTIELNEELNGIELYFSSKPSQNAIDVLKANGFRWHKKGYWYAKQSDQRLSIAEGIKAIYEDVKEVSEAPEQIENEVIESTPEPVEVETTQETYTPEYTSDNKIKVKSITFVWSESSYIKDNTTVSTFTEAEQLIRQAALNAPDNGAYDKTKFKLTFTNGYKYEGRIDIVKSDSFKSTPLKDHISTFANSVITDNEGWHTAEEKQSYKHFIDTYSLVDDTPSPINKGGKVLDFNSRFKQRQEQKEAEEMKAHFLQNVLPYMSQDEIDQLQAAYRSNNEQELNKLWSKLMLSTAVKRAAEEVLKQN